MPVSAVCIGTCIAFRQRVVPTGSLGGASGGAVRCATVLCPKALFLRTADDGSVYHDLCQRRLVFGWQGLEGAGGTTESTAKEELRADE